jgi:hypothetical protein
MQRPITTEWQRDHKPRKECIGSSWKGAGANGSVGSRTYAAKKVYNVNSGQPGFRRESEVGFGQDSKKAFDYFCRMDEQSIERRAKKRRRLRIRNSNQRQTKSRINESRASTAL